MKASAFVLEGSHPVRGWESRRKVSGVIAGVRFFKKGRTFVASDLSPEDVERLLVNRFVRVELFTRPTSHRKEPGPPPEVQEPAAPEKRTPIPDPLAASLGVPVKRRGRKPKITF